MNFYEKKKKKLRTANIHIDDDLLQGKYISKFVCTIELNINSDWSGEEMKDVISD